ncbi:MAG: glycosyltransferase family 2 protein [Lactobacillus sp.]|jgi:glycosyltransferase involved in cell wall biosynthesis|uniref:Glycosyltransferase family 2 protein n=1 Tax=Lacticaseibacillus suilingensis TaxID=2799577 RepID=A0ABW4BIZ8_9LACO|nr:glycosyltransferase family 2 protein [Lacticaseibacillus suilingensis]MCI1895018.1 glycosyltransferase family 2 protein [Lactobacillus sp.]MCI1917502.1 glycosyltransferase family 2 protein [Lactobacillus sp.]MCI1942150.1 glycosyltransferase family 2 protein [Lactobacillus sp.]MCI1972534.1 glycosyltransferase family 2 protein [Lactobacillus sp.]MCI2017437.1 glycosyltransferase family 2 protein [Lactobacillus sp.]
MATSKLTIVVPAYNEEEVLTSSVQKLLAVEDQIAAQTMLGQRADILIVDDGSKDHTWEIIENLHATNSRVRGLRFSRNFGHQSALIAGMSEAVKTADMIVTIDADLQDDPDKIVDMVDAYADGADIVYGVRNNRETDSWFKRTTAQGYYKTLKLLGVELVPNHADFRLMSKRAVETFLQYPERNIFIRGLIPKLGFKTAEVFYKRTPRMAGESKYPLKKMLAFAWDGITSLTIAPVRLILILGTLSCLLAVGMVIYAIVMKTLGLTVHGWSSLMVSLWFVGGVQMISLGVIGEYIGKLTTEVKHRPRYTVQTILD